MAAWVILGFLPHWPILPRVDLNIPLQAFLPAGTLRQGHDQAGWTLQSAIEQDEDNDPFRVDPPVIVKTATTARMATASGLGERRAIADDIYNVLTVVDYAAVQHRTVVVYDDVFTTESPSTPWPGACAKQALLPCTASNLPEHRGAEQPGQR